MENVNKVLPAKYLEKLNTLNLYKVSPRGLEEKGDHVVITIYGGFNGNGDWITYLNQITTIIQALDAWVIDLINDCPR